MGKKLLLADDSITIQKVVGIIFSNEDYELTVVDNGQAAIQKAMENRPDIMLIDALMPGKNGYEVCEAARRDPQLAGVPILLMTGAFEPFDEAKAGECGADDFISKPFESQQLIEKVKLLVEMGSRRVAAPVAAPAPAPAPAPAAPTVAPAPAAAAPVAPAAPVAAAAPQMTTPLDDMWADDDVFAAPAPAAPAAAAPAPPVQAAAPAPAPAAAPSDDDLWGAFELEEVPEGELLEAEMIPTELVEAAPATEAYDPFAFNDDRDTLIPKEDVAASVRGFSDDNIAWQPVEEETFEFDIEPQGAAKAAEPAPVDEFDFFVDEPAVAAPAAPEPPPAPVMEFEPFTLEDEPAPAAAPAVDLVSPGLAAAAAAAMGAAPVAAPPVVEPVAPVMPAPVMPVAAPAPAPEPPPMPAPAVVPPPVAPVAPVQPAPAGEVTLSEDQLASLVARISRDIIERIAWEVVPDLAEALIKEEIRKIKEGK